jgi:hypothetical protein
LTACREEFDDTDDYYEKVFGSGVKVEEAECGEVQTSQRIDNVVNLQ